MKKACSFCGNARFEDKKVQYIYKHDEKFLIVNDVPCEQCSYCGEQYFKADVLQKIEDDFSAYYFGGRVMPEKITVPVERFG